MLSSINTSRKTSSINKIMLAAALSVAGVMAVPDDANARIHCCHRLIKEFHREAKQFDTNWSHARKAVVPTVIVAGTITACVYGVVVCSIGPAPAAI